MTQLAERSQGNLTLPAVDQSAILKHLGINASDPAAQALILVCQRYDLDPILKHALLIKGRLYVTRDGLMHIAHRSGKFDGMEVVEQGETQSHFTAKVSVWRKDMTRGFTYIGRYPKSGQIAKDYGPEMAVKVGEVMYLRRTFDVALGAAEERWDDEAQKELQQEAKPAQPQARTVDVTREVAQASGAPLHQVNPDSDPERLAQWREKLKETCEKLSVYPGGKAAAIAELKNYPWETSAGACRAAYAGLKQIGVNLKAAQAEAQTQELIQPNEAALPLDIDEAVEAEALISPERLKALQTAYSTRLKLTTPGERHGFAEFFLSLPEPLDSTKNLTEAQATALMDAIGSWNEAELEQAVFEFRVWSDEKAPF